VLSLLKKFLLALWLFVEIRLLAAEEIEKKPTTILQLMQKWRPFETLQPHWDDGD